jgi:tight adherence protein C
MTAWSPLLAALTAAGAVLVAAAAARPAPARVGALVTGARRPRSRPDPLVALGRVALGRGADAAAARRLGRALVLAVLALPLVPPAAPAVGLLAWSTPALAARRRRRRFEAAVVGELPEVVDLLVLVVGGGATVPLALASVAPRCPGPVGAGLAGALRDAALGRRLADALEELPGRLGDAARPLVAALVANERYGAPLLDGLVRVADEVRHDRRRRAEAAARRIPVTLLFPLVCCTLPAFGLLTVAPLLAGGLRSLRL